MKGYHHPSSIISSSHAPTHPAGPTQGDGKAAQHEVDVVDELSQGNADTLVNVKSVKTE
ncbi:hypothetical protein [Lapillicoccus jejuensis]|uniref:hypothetical protein n=1 Tax=Lapillicoccus jejuensis TaxID=402171 RepID=UPI001477175C|nr:hypothetical protein [Lapillicoccus jejuensis]